MMKYVVMNNISTGIEEIFIFDKTIDHDRFVVGVESIKADNGVGGWLREYRECVSAGFVKMNNGLLQCYGESITLNIKSRGDQDSVLLLELHK